MFKSKFFKSTLVLLLAFLMVFGSVACSAKPSEKSFKSAYEKEIDNALSKVETYYGVIDDYNFTDMKLDASITVDVSDDLLSVLKNQSSYDFAWVNDAKISFTENFKGDAMSMAYALAYKTTEVVSAEMILDFVGNELFVKLPQLTDKVLGHDLSEEMGDEAIGALAMLKGIDVMEILPDIESVKGLLKSAYTQAIKHFEDVTFKEVKLEVNGVTQKCIAYEVELTEEDVADIVLDMLKMLKTDNDFKKIVTDLIKSAGDIAGEAAGPILGDADQLYNMLVEEIDGLIKDMEENKDEVDDDEVMVEWTSYITTKMDVIGTEIKVPDADCTIYMATAKAKNDVGVEMYVEVADQKMVELTGTIKNDGKKISGECKIEAQGSEVATVTLADIDVAQLDKGLFVGSVTIAPSKEISDMIAANAGEMLTQLGINVSDLAIKFSVTKNDGKEMAMSVALMNKKDVYVGINLDAKISAGSTVAVPDDSNVITDAEAWAENVSLDGLINKINEAGLPSYIVDLLEGALAS